MNPFRISKSSFFNEYSGIPDFFSSRTKTIDEKEEMGPSQIQIQGFQNLVSLKALNSVWQWSLLIFLVASGHEERVSGIPKYCLEKEDLKIVLDDPSNESILLCIWIKL
jgi:hypothetical protein